MPNLNGMGPNGAGPMSGRGMGPCNEAVGTYPRYGRGRGRGFGPGMGYGMGYGRGSGRGWGPGRGWAAIGYGPGGEEIASATMRSALEERKAFLRAELARTEALLADSAEGASGSGESEK